jgi:hypothetical protein
MQSENLTKLLRISTKNTALCADALTRHVRKAISVRVITFITSVSFQTMLKLFKHTVRQRHWLHVQGTVMCDFLTSNKRFFSFTRNTQLHVHLTQYTNNNLLGEVVTTIVFQILSCAQWGLQHTNRSPRTYHTIWLNGPLSAHNF